MKAISIRQPWAWAVLAGGKTVENRSRNIAGAHRGPLLIHAGQHLATPDAFDRVADLGAAELPMLGAPGAVVEADLSGVIGVADLVGVHTATSCSCSCSPWADATGWHLRLANPRVLRRTVPCPGRLGLFTPPDDVLQEVHRWMP